MKNLIKKDKKRRKAVERFEFQRINYKSIIANLSLSPALRIVTQLKLNNLPRQSSKTQIRNRCILTGRGRGVYKFCKLSRLSFRELSGRGKLAGVAKLSW